MGQVLVWRACLGIEPIGPEVLFTLIIRIIKYNFT